MSHYPLAMATRIADRQTVWVSAADNAKNSDGRPSSYVSWGVPATVITAQYAEAHAAERRCPISGWVSGSTVLDPMQMADPSYVSAVRRHRGLRG